MLRDIMDTPVKFDDRAVIVIPDLAVGELEIFLQNMYKHKVVFVVSSECNTTAWTLVQHICSKHVAEFQEICSKYVVDFRKIEEIWK